MATAGSGSGRRAHRRTGIERTPEPDEYLREARDFCERSPAEQREIMRKSEPMISENAVANTEKSRRPWLRKRPNVGRPRSTPWVGSLGDFANTYTISRLADELNLDPMQIGRWCRGDYAPSIQKAIALVEVARRSGVDLTLEEIYSRHFARIRERIRSGEPPL
jgi:Helix-turn-helix